MNIYAAAADAAKRLALAVQWKLAPKAPPNAYTCWPLANLADGRKPVITSGHCKRNPERHNHYGCDLFYRWKPEDGPVKIGDGGATGSRGVPKWFIPDGTHAVAVAPGKVVLAGPSATGFRVWLEIGPQRYVGYFHLRDCLVTAGQFVFAGDKLGRVHDNPRDTDAKHLHFEEYQGDLTKYPRGTVDPQDALERTKH